MKQGDFTESSHSSYFTIPSPFARRCLPECIGTRLHSCDALVPGVDGVGADTKFCSRARCPLFRKWLSRPKPYIENAAFFEIVPGFFK
jgi:hypothetical protein